MFCPWIGQPGRGICKGCAAGLPRTVGIKLQHRRHGTLVYYKYQCPLPILVLGFENTYPFRLYICVGSEISPNFIFWLYFSDDSSILCRPFHCDQFSSITKTRKASMEQIADLYTMENTTKATASTSRNTGSRNENGELFV